MCLNYSLDIANRNSFWGVIIGGITYWSSFNSVNQTMVQRYMSLPSLKNARWSIFIYVIGMVCFVSLCCFAGLLIFAFFENCDPMAANLVKVFEL